MHPNVWGPQTYLHSADASLLVGVALLWFTKSGQGQALAKGPMNTSVQAEENIRDLFRSSRDGRKKGLAGPAVQRLQNASRILFQRTGALKYIRSQRRFYATEFSVYQGRETGASIIPSAFAAMTT